METLSELVTRLKKELNQARNTRDRIEKTGLSSSFGGISFSNAAYDQVLRRIARLEQQLFDAEEALNGSTVRADVREVRVCGI